MSRTLLCLCAIIFLALPSYAVTDAAREFERLTQEKDKELAAAAVPIMKRYQAALEQLLRRASQTGDAETAVKVGEVLKQMGTEGKPKTAGDLKAQLLSGNWDWWVNDSCKGESLARIDFLENGSVRNGGKGKAGNGWKWEVVSEAQLKISIPSGAFWIFDMNLSRHEGKVNPAASTIKDDKSLKLAPK